MKEVREFKWLAAVENPELLALWSSAEEVWSNQFIDGLLTEGVKRWEDMLGIRAKDTDTMAMRRRKILAKINEQLPYTHRTLAQKLAAICGPDMARVEIDYNRYMLNINLDLSVMENTAEIDRLLQAIAPANLIKKMQFKRPLTTHLQVGQAMRFGKKMTIHPVNRFSLTGVAGSSKYGFAIRKASYKIIKAVI